IRSRCWNWRRRSISASASRPIPSQPGSGASAQKPRRVRLRKRPPKTTAATSVSTLVVQSPEATALRAAALAELCGSAPPEALDRGAWRLRGATRREGVAAWCDAHRLDHAWVPEGRRFSDLKLLAMDMDSTLITI